MHEGWHWAAGIWSQRLSIPGVLSNWLLPGKIAFTVLAVHIFFNVVGRFSLFHNLFSLSLPSSPGCNWSCIGSQRADLWAFIFFYQRIFSASAAESCWSKQHKQYFIMEVVRVHFWYIYHIHFWYICLQRNKPCLDMEKVSVTLHCNSSIYKWFINAV